MAARGGVGAADGTWGALAGAVAVVPDGGLLAVHAHPDDETLASGALLATWAAAGQRVTVVTCTRGERGEVIDTPAHPTGVGHLEGDGPRLAAHREGELARALAALGVRDHVFLDTSAAREHPAADGVPAARYTDSGMAWAAPGIARAAAEAELPDGAFVAVPLDEAARRLAAVVRDRRPAVVVTYESGGGYGHPDHVRAHEVTVRALALLVADGTAVPPLWTVVAPEGAVRAARRALPGLAGVRDLLARAPVALPDPDEQLPPLVVPDAAERAPGARQVPVAPVLDAVVAALRAHATQVQHVGVADEPADALVGWYALSNDVLAPLPSHEFYLPSRAALPGSPDPGPPGQ
ncbi:PIG-L family deacetylase [Cellulosimicrobium marinum]|uniref:PIG-L family deacetylase n=1 Tax=Cellulosimicrobium marinum TaxID=1638992 RepID=UPI001E380328|nr:PIG-L family deacetylase [Cellulosimicrobium marinum]MCB7136526.1 PIG-L family deacetylase [Cellulosimicrobium marinum]